MSRLPEVKDESRCVTSASALLNALLKTSRTSIQRRVYTMSATRTKTEITSDAIYKVTTRATGQQCYAVPSDSQSGMSYMTCWNSETQRWECTCRAGEVAAERQQSATCKHARAAQASILANKAARERQQEEQRLMD